MASIEKRTDKQGVASYRVKIRMRGHPPQTATFARLTDARKWVADTESAIRQGRHFQVSEAKKRTVSDLIKAYRTEVLPRLRSANAREVHLQWWDEVLGPYLLADVRPALLLDTRKALFDKPSPRGNVSQSTVNRYCSTMSHAFSWAMKERQWVSDNPFFKIANLKEPEGVIRFLSDEERTALLEAAEAKSPDLYAIIVLALSTGARRNEILGLKWPEVDLKTGLLTFAKTKNGSVRRVPVTGKALDLLKDMAAARKLKDPSGLVFPGKTDKTKDKPLAIENIFQAALKDAAIANFRFHDLRHSAASYLVMAGVPMVTVAEILGHRDLKMTQRYSHLSRAHVSEAVGKLDSVMFGGGA
jgi:integrase